MGKFEVAGKGVRAKGKDDEREYIVDVKGKPGGKKEVEN